MGVAIDTISGSVIAPGATLTPWVVNSGDSLAVRNAALTDPVWLLQAWNKNNAAGTFRLRSPRLHDNVQGLRQAIVPGQVDFHLSFGGQQRLYPQDTLIAEQSGSVTGGQIENGSLLLYYTNLPGISATLIDPATLMKRAVQLLTNEVTITPSGAAGYSAAVALNSSFDLLIANTWYAVVGFSVSNRIGAVCLRGPDTGNLRVSAPGETLHLDMIKRWFILLSHYSGLPLIPCVNSANKGSTLIDLNGDQTATATTIDIYLVQLTPP